MATLAEMLAAQGALAPRNPVSRFLMGLESTQAEAPTQPAAAQASPPAAQEAKKQPSGGSAIMDKLLARMMTGRDVGFAIPAGPGVIPGAALRPEARKAFEDVGGVVGIDVSNMTAEEQSGLALLLDPAWVARHQ